MSVYKDQSKGLSRYNVAPAAILKHLSEVRAGSNCAAGEDGEKDSSSCSAQPKAAGVRTRALRVDLSGCKYELCKYQSFCHPYICPAYADWPASPLGPAVLQLVQLQHSLLPVAELEVIANCCHNCSCP
jgi:hypothetical protein